MIRGSCLCGGVRFEVDRVVGPFELCHCNRCRKTSGSAFMAAVGVKREDFRWVSGRELVRVYDAPIVETPPAYRSCFCECCGSPVPDPTSEDPWFEIAAGALEGEVGRRPDKHIFVEVKSSWYEIADDLPQLDKQALLRHRQGGR
jgi:hypothetical protein